MIDMTKDQLVAKLRDAGFEIRSQVRVQSHDRWRLILADGAIVDCLDDGPGVSADMIRMR